MDGASVQVSADRIVYRASALGGCSRALLAARLEYEPIAPPKAVQERFDAGHAAEEPAIDALRGMTRLVVADRQMEVELDVSSRIKVVGHIDGRNAFNGDGIEIKSQGQADWDAFERHGWESGFFPRYKWQFSVYIIALGRGFTLVRYNRDTGECKTEFVSEPFYSLAEIRERVLRVEATAQSGVLLADCDLQMYPCPYFYTHDETDTELVDDSTIDVLAREHEKAKKAAEVAKGQIESIRKTLRDKATEVGVVTKNVAGNKTTFKTTAGTRVTFYDAQNPSRTDTVALAAEMAKKGMKLEDYKIPGGVSERLKITFPKDKVDEDTKGWDDAG